MYRLLGRHYNIQYNLEHFLMSKFQMTASNAQEAINFHIFRETFEQTKMAPVSDALHLKK